MCLRITTSSSSTKPGATEANASPRGAGSAARARSSIGVSDKTQEMWDMLKKVGGGGVGRENGNTKYTVKVGHLMSDFMVSNAQT